VWYPYQAGLPLIAITLSGPNSIQRRLLALVDSGADDAVFDIRLAEEVFKLRRSDAKKGDCGGIGRDRIPTWSWPGATFRIEFAGEVIPLVDLEFIELNGHPVLGRDDFFRTFSVAFDQPRAQMYLSPRSEWLPP
jgi:hypothetical protein